MTIVTARYTFRDEKDHLPR